MNINIYPAKNGIGSTTLGLAITHWLNKHYRDRDGKPCLCLPDVLDAQDAFATLGRNWHEPTDQLWGTLDANDFFLAWGHPHNSSPTHSTNRVTVHTANVTAALTPKILDDQAINILVTTNNYVTLRRAMVPNVIFTTCYNLQQPTGVLSERDVSNVLSPMLWNREVHHSTNYEDIRRAIDAGLFTSSVDRGHFSNILQFLMPLLLKPAFFAKEFTP